MSTPTNLGVPGGVDVLTIGTPRGDFAAHEARPSGVSRGHVLLIPGFTGSKEDFTPILPLLAADGWHATAYDQRGQYETVGAPDADYSLDGFAADALAVRESVAGAAPQSHVVGHSFGGLVAQAAVLESPRTWASLTLLCTGPGGFTIERQTKPLGAFIDAVPRLGLAKVFEIQQEKKAPVPPEVLAFLRTRYTANSPDSMTSIARHLIDAPDRVDELVALGLPVFVVRGADDNEWPPQVQAETAARL
ncbi:MAG: alpha/beta fold hydrolase, partial [Nocardioidaceae bacterium]